MGNSYANLKKKDLLAIVGDSSRTELETALADKFRCKSQANEIGELRARIKAGGLNAHAAAKTIKECK